MAKNKKETEENGLWEMIKSLVIAIVIAMIFRTILYAPFHIPSGSMKPTLLVGDYLFVSKFSYGYSHYSLPFGVPLFEGRIFDEAPKRGDVIVFKKPGQENIDYIKRLIGLPGDKIKMIHGTLFINNQAVKKERIDDFVETFRDGSVKRIPQYIETLENGVSYRILDEQVNGVLDTTIDYEVPEGHYFFMGDNRDNSQDSRVLDKVGYVPEINLVGRATIIFFSTRARLVRVWEWISEFRLERFWEPVAFERET